MNLEDLKKKNEELKQELSRVKLREKELEMVLNRITSAKAFRLWQMIKKTQNFILSSFYYSLHKVNMPSLVKPPSIDVVKERVSVIIPTWNGGSDYKKNLSAIFSQKNIKDLEVIVIDDKSKDDTASYSRSMGARVYLNPLAEFSHSKVRNFGASKATGKYLIFTVQDAYLKDPYAICKLVNFVKINRLAAASGMQYPKDDAESFAIWLNHRHYKVINPNNRNLIYGGESIKKNIDKYSFIQKRKLVVLDDVFACYDSEAFYKFWFSEKVNFGEDAEIALRLLRLGYKIGLTKDSVVYHSHNRSPYYLFKRSFSDTISLKTIFGLTIKGVSWHNFKKQIELFLTILIISEKMFCTKEEVSWGKIASEVEKCEGRVLKRINNLKKLQFYPVVRDISRIANLKEKVVVDKNILRAIGREIDSMAKEYFDFVKKNDLVPERYDLLKIISIVVGYFMAEVIDRHYLNRLAIKIRHYLGHKV